MEYLSFKHKDYKDLGKDKRPKEKILSLHYRDFFPRLLQHVPPPYFRIVRYYGVYSNHGKIPEEYFSKSQEEIIEITEEELQKKNPLYCDYCHQDKVYIATIFGVFRDVFNTQSSTVHTFNVRRKQKSVSNDETVT